MARPIRHDAATKLETADACPPAPGRVALVTGASGGIGRAIAQALAASGHRVAIGYATDRDGARQCAQSIACAGGDAIEVRGDVRDPDDVDVMFGTVEQTWGPVQVLVNNAGIILDGLVARMPDRDWDLVLRTNLDGSFHCIRRAIRAMIRSRWGRIVNVGSVAGLMGSAGQANYAAAKAGLIGLTRSVAREVASRGITVNAVVPGPVDTPILRCLTAEQLDRLRSSVPLGRLGAPEDVAAVAKLLCSDSGAFITGAVIPIDGGMSMGHLSD
jgi:3-oxoacyl-[acyl-carrier protein] reductase